MPGYTLTLAPMLFGVVLNAMLYGTLVVQTHMYFQSYKSRDALWMRMFVYYMLFCETLNTGCDVAVIYQPFIARFGALDVTTTPRILASSPVLTVLVSGPVQLFITWRVKVMSGSSFIPVIIVICSITSFGGIITTITSLVIPNNKSYSVAIVTWLVASAVTDVLITVSLVYNLMCQRTGFAPTDDLIYRIIRLTVQTGMLTSIAATLDVALWLAARGTTLNLIFDFALSKLYSNSLLSTLNARSGWKASSSARDNVLFGNAPDITSMQRSHAQIELVTTDIHARRSTGIVPMKAFESASAYHHEDSSSITVSPKIVDEV